MDIIEMKYGRYIVDTCLKDGSQVWPSAELFHVNKSMFK
jgi:hypothetical protein